MTYWALLLAIFSVPVFADGVLLEHTMPPVQLLHADGTPVEGVAKSTSVGEAMEKAGMLPCDKGVICKYKASWDITLEYKGVDEPVIEPPDPCENPEADGCPCPDSDAVYPHCPVVPDPNEPVDPPIDPNEPTDPDPAPVVAVDDDFGDDWEGQSVKSNDLGDLSSISAKQVGLASNGSVSLFNTGLFNYTDDGTGYCGEVVFSYRLKLQDGFSNTATARFNACPVVVDPNDPVDPPDPNDPPEPPVDPNEPPVVEYPEAAMTYRGRVKLPPYSVPEACPSIHDATAKTVTLRDGETMDSALARLAAITTPEAGGVVEIPAGVDTVQCDRFLVKYRDFEKLTIRGLPADGWLPKFYCRFAETDAEGNKQPGFPEGTIPYRTAEWAQYGGDITGQLPQVLIENLEIDGYRGTFHTGNSAGTYIIRATYAHHGRGDGFDSGGTASQYTKDIEKGTDAWRTEPQILDYHVCGSEISYTGQDNGQHGLYLHGAFGGVDPDNADLAPLDGNGVHSWGKLHFVDNYCHDMNYSSCLKALTNENIIVGNRLAHVEATDPTFPQRPTSMLIDIPACSLVDIRYNEFILFNGSYGIAARNRRMPQRGCDMPAMWYPINQDDAEGNTRVPDKIDGPWHTAEWWTDLNGEQFFRWNISGNTFRVSPVSEKPQNAKPITNMGTYPNFQSGFGGDSCYLPTPMTWYERSEMVVTNNTYVGIPKENAYTVETPQHSYKNKCPEHEVPPGPQPSGVFSDYFNIGSGEAYLQ